MSHQPAILLTGRPGVGKSTIIKVVVSRLGQRAGGFYTREVRVAGKRMGFEVVTLAGETDLLATKSPDITFATEAPFGKYRVNLSAIDKLAVRALHQAMAQRQIVVIDEIGPMELLSEKFCQAVQELLDAPVIVLGTVVERPHPLADRIKQHPRIQLQQITLANRDLLPHQIETILRQWLVAR
ncbi:MAG: AAA family ATPase [Anaerolineae bacterium]|nr:AAA family ATPase [Anaerolineae bacterium]